MLQKTGYNLRKNKKVMGYLRGKGMWSLGAGTGLALGYDALTDTSRLTYNISEKQSDTLNELVDYYQATPKVFTNNPERVKKYELKQGESDLSKLELQYQQALNEGDLESANKIMTLMDSLSKTQASLISARGSPTYKASMKTGDFSDLAAKMFPVSLDPDSKEWVMPDEHINAYTNLMTQFTKATANLDTNPSTSFLLLKLVTFFYFLLM